MNAEQFPSREDVLKAIELVTKGPDGESMALTDDERRAQLGQLVGILDVAVDDLSRRCFEGKGRGNSQRMLVVLGYRSYLRHRDTQPGALMRFFQRRFSRMASDMDTALHSVG